MHGAELFVPLANLQSEEARVSGVMACRGELAIEVALRRD